MAVVVGCDIVALSEIEESCATFGDRFLRRVFTAAEIADCQGTQRIERLAARFAAKEAAIKALAIVDAPTPPREIEVVGRSGPPRLRLHGSIAAVAADRGWTSMSVSLSHSGCHAMAVVVAQTQSTIR